MVSSFVVVPSRVSHRSTVSASPLQATTQKQDHPGGVTAYLGKGPNAVIRQGSVLVAPPNEYHHFYKNSAIFVYSIGLDPEEKDGNEYVIRGVILDHPTPFTLSEMIESERTKKNPLGDTLVFRGGDRGGEGVLLVHNSAEIGGCDNEIGTSGLYQGNWDDVLSACAAGSMDAENNAKVFFNYCEFSESELESLMTLDKETGDGWLSVEVEPRVVLNPDYDRGSAWSMLRNAVREERMR